MSMVQVFYFLSVNYTTMKQTIILVGVMFFTLLFFSTRLFAQTFEFSEVLLLTEMDRSFDNLLQRKGFAKFGEDKVEHGVKRIYKNSKTGKYLTQRIGYQYSGRNPAIVNAIFSVTTANLEQIKKEIDNNGFKYIETESTNEGGTRVRYGKGNIDIYVISNANHLPMLSVNKIFQQ